MSKLLITVMKLEDTPCIVAARQEEGRIVWLQFAKKGASPVLGNIYLAYTDKISENIQSAFLEYQKQENCYFSLKEQDMLLFSDPRRRPPLKPGDEVAVQIAREAMKGKLPYATANLNFTGKYLVLTTGNRRLGISEKLTGEDRLRLRKWFQEEELSEYGLVVRTNAKDAPKEELERELRYLKKRFEQVKLLSRSRRGRTLLLEAEPFYLKAIRDMYQETLEGIVVDDNELYVNIKAYLQQYEPENLEKLAHYEDRQLPLAKLYRLESALEEIRREKIWLKSGGSLVIEQTEAFVSIDVNTGKFTQKKKRDETFRKINLEAAAEIARQLRLRNLSGTILIDFINLSRKEHQEELLHVLQKHLSRDPVKTSVVDITKLNIVEVTRQKICRPVAEELKF